MATSPAKSKMVAMIAEQFVQLQLKIMQKNKNVYISYGITRRADISKSASTNNCKMVFGPLLDAPPAHPDTVLTTLIYLERTLKWYAHLSVDLQLYQISCIVQWSDPYHWQSLVLHPGMMHTLMSFLTCIGILMKISGFDVLLTAAVG